MRLTFDVGILMLTTIVATLHSNYTTDEVKLFEAECTKFTEDDWHLNCVDLTMYLKSRHRRHKPISTRKPVINRIRVISSHEKVRGKNNTHSEIRRKNQPSQNGFSDIFSGGSAEPDFYSRPWNKQQVSEVEKGELNDIMGREGIDCYDDVIDVLFIRIRFIRHLGL